MHFMMTMTISSLQGLTHFQLLLITYKNIQHVASIYWGIKRTQVARSAIVPCLTLLLQLLLGITTG